MKRVCILYLFVFLASFSLFAQVGIGTTTPNPKAVLDLVSPGNNQGVLVPRLTTVQRNAITGLTANENGLLVFDSDLGQFYYWNGTAWMAVDMKQDLSLIGNTLSITGNPSATPIDLAPFAGTNTDNQTLSFSAPTLSIAGGNSVNLSSINTDNQDLSLSANTLSLTGDATSVNLAGYLDNTDSQTLNFTSPSLSISGGNAVDLSTLNTDNQDLNLSGNTLSLTGDATSVNLAGYLDNTDNQDLSLTGNTLSLSGDATSVNLAGYLDNTDSQNLSLGTKTGTSQAVNISGGTGISIDVADNDNSSTNEIQSLSLAGTTLSLSNGGGSVALPSGVSGSGSATQVAVWNGSSSLAGSSNLIWDEKIPGLGLGTTPRTTLHNAGSLAVGVKFADKEPYLVADVDYLVVVPSATTQNVEMPLASTVIGRVVVIKVTGSDDRGVTINPSSGSKDAFDGAGSIIMGNLNQGDINSVTLVAAQDGNWVIISKVVL